MICGALRDLIPFVQFKKHEKHPWRSVTNGCRFTKSNTSPWVFFTFFKFYKWYHIAQRITGGINPTWKKSQWLFKAHYSVISATYNFMKQREAFLYFLRRDRHRYFILFVSFWMTPISPKTNYWYSFAKDLLGF